MREQAAHRFVDTGNDKEFRALHILHSLHKIGGDDERGNVETDFLKNLCTA